MKKLIIYLVIGLLCSTVLVGCLVKEGAQNDNIGGNDDLQDDYPIAYNTQQEEAERNGTNVNNPPERNREHYLEGFTTGLKKPDNQNTKYTEQFYNEESQKVSEAVNKIEAVSITQVFSTEDQIFVSPLLEQTEYKDQDDVDRIVEQVRKQVRQIVPDKEIVIYTDDIYWNEMRNINARNVENPDEARDYIQDFIDNFNQ
ncbi:YhcN/YlaJ family sporulation lipoprotein [Aquibacillus koreensis]|uniref:YhcN/YlaJ family sporulation lipoprotein n=1 Tax=Aquibacillus koreensis TaxID=279446 RepID=A0A9X3WL66_9BACI|nr:YhcN/YlaJ family sporulation lipoprotein [Aquibacillus koreensis]MCT2537978.1 YhcN/YlaJ family sporulation lipoprotein [Aquibacillus koreensis]MDC3419131.1 YhcN/YlaJ family sporulation lipoprotein [Aquibacillus koreensis]